jgi:hypothetical protein
MANHGLQILIRSSRKKQFISVKLHAVLHSVMKSCTVLFYPALNVNHPFIQCIHAIYAAHSLVTS